MKLKLLLWCIWFRGKKLFGIIGLSVRGYRLEKSSPGSLFPSDVILTISRDCLSNSTVPFCLCWLSPRKQKKITRHLDFDRLNFFVTSYISWWFFFYCSSLCGNVFFLPLASSGSDDDKKCVPIIKPISLWCRKGCKKFNLVIYL